MRTTEVAVVGAGLIGLSIAYELASRGAAVRIFDRAGTGRGASWAGAGMLAPFTESIDDAQLSALLVDSLQRYPAFVQSLLADSGIDAHLRLDGILDIATDDEGWKKFAVRANVLAQRGRTCELLDAAQTIAIEPALSASLRGGLLVHGEGQVDNRRLGRALRAACEFRGVKVSDGCAVESLETDARRVRGLRTAAGFVSAQFVINATGAWSAQLPGVPHDCIAPVFPVKGQMLALEIPKGFIRHVTWSHGVYFVPRSDGRLLVGATVEDAGFDARVTAEGISDLLNGTLAAAPALRNFAISETWAGLRPGTPDGRPTIGATALEGYYLATGHYRNGILLAPVTATLIADLLEKRGAPEPASS